MAATYEWSETNHTAPGDITDAISTINFGNADNPNLSPVSNYPITAGENAYEKYIRAKFSGTFTKIENMKFWKSAGDYKTGETIAYRLVTTYATPVITDMGGTTLPITEGTAVTIHASDGTTLYIDSPGYTEYFVLQLKTSGATPAGAVNQKTMKFQYDET